MTPFEWFISLPLLTQMFFVYLAVINIITFFAFGLDKFAATQGNRRTPEKKLWFLSAIGGSLGAISAMEFFAHKRRKVSFYGFVFLCFILHLFLIMFILQ